MFDSETLRPVIIAMVLFIVLVKAIPQVIKDQTNMKVVDDITMLAVSLNGFMMPGTILIGIIVYLTGYINTKML